MMSISDLLNKGKKSKGPKQTIEVCFGPFLFILFLPQSENGHG